MIKEAQSRNAEIELERHRSQAEQVVYRQTIERDDCGTKDKNIRCVCAVCCGCGGREKMGGGLPSVLPFRFDFIFVAATVSL